MDARLLYKFFKVFKTKKNKINFYRRRFNVLVSLLWKWFDKSLIVKQFNKFDKLISKFIYFKLVSCKLTQRCYLSTI